MSDERLLELVEKQDKYYILGFINGIRANNEILKQEIKELKKQLEATEEIVETHMKKWKAMENQQKEFIDYMKKTIGKLECDDVDDEDLKGYLLQRIDTFKEILQKYKEINHIADTDKQ